MKQTVAQTSSLRMVSECFEFLLDQVGEQMGLVWGPPGTGKTTAAKAIANEYGAIYFSCFPEMTPYFLVTSLLKQTAFDKKPRSYVRAIEALIAEIQDSRRAIFIDEANFLTSRRELLELLRTVHDHAGIPVIFVGMSGILEKFNALPLFADRIQFFCEVSSCSFMDAKTLAGTRCEILIADDLLSKIHQEGKNNLRLIKRMLAHVEHSCKGQAEAVTIASWGDRNLLPKGSVPPSQTKLVAFGRGGSNG